MCTIIMCWSAEVSLRTWLLTVLFSIMTKKTMDPKLWLLFTTFSQVQLAEYFIWTDLNSALASMFGFFIIFLEPIVSLNFLDNKILRNKLIALYSLIMLIPILTKKIDFKNTVGKDGHLVWNWQDPGLIYTIIWSLFFLVPLFISGYHKTFMVTLGLMLYSLNNYLKYGTWTSMWCWFAIFAWIPFVLKATPS